MDLTTLHGETRTTDADGIRLFDRADGVRGRYCIGFKDTTGTCHWWGRGDGRYGWCSAGVVFNEADAHEYLALIKEKYEST